MQVDKIGSNKSRSYCTIYYVQYGDDIMITRFRFSFHKDRIILLGFDFMKKYNSIYACVQVSEYFLIIKWLLLFQNTTTS